jgi:hypothetical protein
MNSRVAFEKRGEADMARIYSKMGDFDRAQAVFIRAGFGPPIFSGGSLSEPGSCDLIPLLGHQVLGQNSSLFTN